MLKMRSKWGRSIYALPPNPPPILSLTQRLTPPLFRLRDLVVLDIDGYRVSERKRSKHEWCEAAAVFFSARGYFFGELERRFGKGEEGMLLLDDDIFKTVCASLITASPTCKRKRSVMKRFKI